MNTAPRRVVLLGRVSTADRQQDPENQLGPLRAAAARLEWIVVKEVALKMSDWDETSAAEVRRRALAPIVAGRADTLAVWSLDRNPRAHVCGGAPEDVTSGAEFTLRIVGGKWRLRILRVLVSGVPQRFSALNRPSAVPCWKVVTDTNCPAHHGSTTLADEQLSLVICRQSANCNATDMAPDGTITEATCNLPRR